jgi:VanZ family protein
MKKSAHVIEYGIFGVLLYRAFRGSGIDRKRSMIFAVAISIMYGVTDEIHQSFTPGREPKIRDVFFDALGASLAVYFVDRKGILNKS